MILDRSVVVEGERRRGREQIVAVGVNCSNPNYVEVSHAQHTVIVTLISLSLSLSLSLCSQHPTHDGNGRAALPPVPTGLTTPRRT